MLRKAGNFPDSYNFNGAIDAAIEEEVGTAPIIWRTGADRFADVGIFAGDILVVNHEIKDAVETGGLDVSIVSDRHFADYIDITLYDSTSSDDILDDEFLFAAGESKPKRKKKADAPGVNGNYRNDYSYCPQSDKCREYSIIAI